jgi:hypothetical protein
MKFPDSRRGGVLSVVLVSILGIVCLMVATAIYIVRNVNIQSRDRPGGADVSIDTPAGLLSVHAHDQPGALPADIPVYPGAKARKDSGGGAVIEWNSNSSGEDKGFSVSAAEMVTNDPLDKVVDYYRADLPDWVTKSEGDGEIQFVLRKGGHKRVVAIHAKHDGTHIGVASVGEPASN